MPQKPEHGRFARPYLHVFLQKVSEHGSRGCGTGGGEHQRREPLLIFRVDPFSHLLPFPHLLLPAVSYLGLGLKNLYIVSYLGLVFSSAAVSAFAAACSRVAQEFRV